MKLILLSGGSGKRLWPMSNEKRSKQFLKVLRNSEGHMESMVQRVWRQLQSASLAECAYFTAGAVQTAILQEQVGHQAQVIIEPERRDTFPAIALASVYLYSVANVPPSETVCVLPVDSFAEDEFFGKVVQLEEVLEHSGAPLALIGSKPTFPSEKYGYILPKAPHPHHQDVLYSRVGRFVEKPNAQSAARYIEQGALWNCGVFAFKLEFMLSMLRQTGFPVHYDALVKQYGELPMNSFDFEVVEKTENITVVPYDGYWKDIGTWNTLTDEIEAGVWGKGFVSSDSVNTHVINELDIPVIVLGLDDIVVACSEDGILVTDKTASPRLKEILQTAAERLGGEKGSGT